MLYKVLAVDDDKKILKIVKASLQYEDISVITACDGVTCLEKAKSAKPDLIILDFDLPDIDGFKLCQVLRSDKPTAHIPIIFLSGKMITNNDMVAGFTAGASDYILKPFEPRILISRVKAVLRWLEYKGELGGSIKKYGIEIDLNDRMVKIKGKQINLTKKEFDLLFTLIRKNDQLVTHKYLLETVWGYEPDIDTHTLDSHISSLRKKLGAAYAKKIIAVKGFGYRFLE